jgi:hypothetical protein
MEKTYQLAAGGTIRRRLVGTIAGSHVMREVERLNDLRAFVDVAHGALASATNIGPRTLWRRPTAQSRQPPVDRRGAHLLQ